MRLQIDDWLFDVDLEATRAYSVQESSGHCDCASCCNFYAAVDAYVPQLRPFLAQFGLQIDAPDRMSPMQYSLERVDYDPMYYVAGSIVEKGSTAMVVGNVRILADQTDALINGRSCFALNIDALSLPWLLDPLEFDGLKPRKMGLLQRLFNKKDDLVQ